MKNKILVYNILFESLLFFSSFCYIKFFNIGSNSDLQIYYFVIGVIGIILFNFKKLNKKLLKSFLILFSVLTFNFFIDKSNLLSFFRGSYAYISFLIIFFVFYKLCLKIDLKKIERRIKIYFLIWNMVGIIQLFNNSYLTFWRNRVGIGNGRGSISLGTEPAYFAFFLILSSLILYSLNENNKKYFVYSLVSTLFLAKSFTGTGYLIVIIFLLYLNKKNSLKIIFLGIIIIILFVIIGHNISQDNKYRIFRLLRLAVYNPTSFFLKDGSAKIRVMSLLFSLKGGIDSYFIPNGFSTWGKYCTQMSMKYKDFLLIDNVEYYQLILSGVNELPSNNINTMFGGIIYELGIIGIFFYWKIYKICKNKKIWWIILILGIDGLNITNPYLAILLAINYLKYKKVRQNENIILNK